MEGGIGLSELRFLTFREVDLILKRQKWLVENSWEQTRLIVAALTHQPPTKIVRLERDGQRMSKKKWTQEEAEAVLRRYNVKK